MEEHGLKQSDLSDIGSQGVVSEILRGKRELNTRQISTVGKVLWCFARSVLLTPSPGASAIDFACRFPGPNHSP